MKTPFKDDVALVHSLIQGYKHMVLGGMHPFYLYMNGNVRLACVVGISYFQLCTPGSQN